MCKPTWQWRDMLTQPVVLSQEANNYHFGLPLASTKCFEVLPLAVEGFGRLGREVSWFLSELNKNQPSLLRQMGTCRVWRNELDDFLSTGWPPLLRPDRTNPDSTIVATTSISKCLSIETILHELLKHSWSCSLWKPGVSRGEYCRTSMSKLHNRGWVG